MNASSNETNTMDEPALETVLLAVGGRDEARVNELVRTVREVTSPSTSRVVLVHLFDRSSHQETVKNVSDSGDAYVEPDELASQMPVVQSIADRIEELPVDCDVRATTSKKGWGSSGSPRIRTPTA